MAMDMMPVDDQHETTRLAKDWLTALAALIASDPAAAKASIADIEHKAELGRQLISETTACAGASVAVSSGALLNGGRHTESGAATQHYSNPSASHGLTRNQLTKVRGVYIMEALTAEGGPHLLSAIHARLIADGFSDEDGAPVSESAVRSHLYRLAENGRVTSVSKGLYKLSKDGYEDLERERIAYAPLIEKFRAG